MRYGHRDLRLLNNEELARLKSKYLLLALDELNHKDPADPHADEKWQAWNELHDLVVDEQKRRAGLPTRHDIAALQTMEVHQ